MVIIKPQPSFYTPEQLDTYLNFLEIPEVKGHATVDTLNKIMRQSLLKIPFENTEMHYTEKGDVNVAPDYSFKRMVIEKEGGGYCLSQNTLLLGMLRALGYRAYGTLSRVNWAQDDSGVTLTVPAHMVVLAQLPDQEKPQTWVLDLGFGMGIVRPILLEDGATTQGGWPGIVNRVAKTVNPTSGLDLEDPSSARLAEEWAVQTNEGHSGTLLPEGKWRTLFHFTLQEYFLGDFSSTSIMVANMPYGICWSTVLCVKWIATQGADDAMNLRVLAGSKVTERGADGLKVLAELKTEQERIAALREHFGIDYPEESGKYIARTGAAIKVA